MPNNGQKNRHALHAAARRAVPAELAGMPAERGLPFLHSAPNPSHRPGASTTFLRQIATAS